MAPGPQVKFRMQNTLPSQAHWSPALGWHTFFPIPLEAGKDNKQESLVPTILLPVSVDLMMLGMSHDWSPTEHVLLPPILYHSASSFSLVPLLSFLVDLTTQLRLTLNSLFSCFSLPNRRFDPSWPLNLLRDIEGAPPSECCHHACQRLDPLVPASIFLPWWELRPGQRSYPWTPLGLGPFSHSFAQQMQTQVLMS